MQAAIPNPAILKRSTPHCKTDRSRYFRYQQTLKCGQRVTASDPMYIAENLGEIASILIPVIRIGPQVMFIPENTCFKDDRVKQVLGPKVGLKGAHGKSKPGMPADGGIQDWRGP